MHKTHKSLHQHKTNMKAKVIQKKQSKWDSFKKTERSLNRSCDQMDVILRKIHHLDHRRKLSLKRENNPVTMTLSLQLDVLRGMYNMYYQYADVKAKQLHELSQECCEEMALFDSDSDDVVSCID